MNTPNQNKSSQTQTQNNNIFSNSQNTVDYRKIAELLSRAPTNKHADELLTELMIKLKLDIDDLERIYEELKKIDYLRYLELIIAVEDDDEYKWNPDLDDY